MLPSLLTTYNVKVILIPSIIRYQNRHGNVRGFPDLTLPEDICAEAHFVNDRSIGVYQVLASCGINPNFVLTLWRVMALKMIDSAHSETSRKLEWLTTQQINTLIDRVGQPMDSLADLVIIETMYDPIWYEDDKIFSEFVNGLHWEFMMEAEEGRLVSLSSPRRKNCIQVDWKMALKYWFRDTVQQRIKDVFPEVFLLIGCFLRIRIAFDWLVPAHFGMMK